MEVLAHQFGTTGDLRRCVQVFEMEAASEAAARKPAHDVVAKFRWQKPKKIRVLVPDRLRSCSGG